MRAPTGMAQLIAQTENNLIKELPLRGSWHGAAVTEGVRQPRAHYRNLCKIPDLLIYCFWAYPFSGMGGGFSMTERGTHWINGLISPPTLYS